MSETVTLTDLLEDPEGIASAATVLLPDGDLDADTLVWIVEAGDDEDRERLLDEHPVELSAAVLQVLLDELGSIDADERHAALLAHLDER